MLSLTDSKLLIRGTQGVTERTSLNWLFGVSWMLLMLSSCVWGCSVRNSWANFAWAGTKQCAWQAWENHESDQFLVNTHVQSYALLCRGFGTSVPFMLPLWGSLTVTLWVTRVTFTLWGSVTLDSGLRYWNTAYVSLQAGSGVGGCVRVRALETCICVEMVKDRVSWLQMFFISQLHTLW